MKRIILAAPAVLAVCALPAAAKVTGGTELAFTTSINVVAPIVEQQSPNWDLCWRNINDPACDQSLLMRNFTGCQWDIDDNHVASGYGLLYAGQTVSDSFCLISDNAYHLNGGWVVSPSDDLVVELTFFIALPVVFTLSPVLRPDGYYEYRGCAIGPRISNGPEIPDSNGGYGTYTTLELSVHNPTSRTVRKTTARVEHGIATGQRKAFYCTGSLGGEQVVSGYIFILAG